MQKLEKGPIPKYYQLEQILRSRITAKEILPDELFPTEMELCNEFDVSRATVRQAIKALEYDGLVRREQGRGTTVLPGNQKKVTVKLYGPFEKIFEADRFYETTLISKKLVNPDKEVMTDMKMDSGQKVYYFEAIRTNPTQKSISYVQAHVPQDIGAKISIKKNQSKGLLIRRVEAVVGEAPYRLLWLSKAELADNTVSTKLHVKKGAPLLVIKRLYFTRDGRAVERAVSYIHSDMYQYEMELFMS